MTRPEASPPSRERRATAFGAGKSPRLGTAQRILFSAADIQQRVNDLSAEIAARNGPGDLIAVAILKGSFVFMADLARRLSERHVHLIVDFMALSSYGAKTVSSGHVRMLRHIGVNVTGRRVLLVDDILDTGLTLTAARQALEAAGASEIWTCVLLNKPARRAVPIEADYVGFTVENVFAVGYGLDFNDRYRNLPHIAALSPQKSTRSSLTRVRTSS